MIIIYEQKLRNSNLTLRTQYKNVNKIVFNDTGLRHRAFGLGTD